MAPKTIRTALADALEDLSRQDFEKFCHYLLDRREEPRIKRSKVEDKSRLQITDVLVSHFTEDGALQVALEVLRQIGCSEEARTLEKDTGGQCSAPGSSKAGAAGVPIKADGKHFVDKYRVQLIQRVSNISPILDELFGNDVINQETYDRIRAVPTSQDKMRELFNGPLKAGTTCKDIFYEILLENEKYLIAELNAKN